MPAFDFKSFVAAAVAVRFDDFAGRHPPLAGVIDLMLLVDAVADSLDGDREFQTALAAARHDEAGVESLVALIDRRVIAWFDRLA